MDGLAEFLAGQGFVTATIDYRLAPAHPFPAAVRFVKAEAAEFGGDSQRVATLGASAGGALAMMAAYCSDPDAVFGDRGDRSVSPAVAAVANAFGPADFTNRAERAPWYRRLAVDYSGTELDADPASWKLASPRHHLTADADSSRRA
jgi:pectinesterase